MIRFVFLLLVVVCSYITSSTFAQGLLSTDRLTLRGYLDGYYTYDFSRPPSKDRVFTTGPLRHNEFNLNLALVDLTYETEKVHSRLVLQSGTYVQANYGAEPPVLQHLHEGYLGLQLGQTNWWLDMGLFASHIGLEGATSLDQWAYSRSLMADFSPFFETGLRLSGPISTKSTFTFVLVNGWQNIRENNDDKAIGTQLQHQLNDRMLLNWSTFIGNEAPTHSPSQLRIFNNWFIQTQIHDRVETALIFDSGFQKCAIQNRYDAWYATAFYTRAQVTPQIHFAGRLEYYSDEKQVIIPSGTPNGFQTFSISANIDYTPIEKFKWRLESRFYQSKDAVFPSNTGFKKNSGTITMSFAMYLE